MRKFLIFPSANLPINLNLNICFLFVCFAFLLVKWKKLLLLLKAPPTYSTAFTIQCHLSHSGISAIPTTCLILNIFFFTDIDMCLISHIWKTTTILWHIYDLIFLNPSIAKYFKVLPKFIVSNYSTFSLQSIGLSDSTPLSKSQPTFMLKTMAILSFLVYSAQLNTALMKHYLF